MKTWVGRFGASARRSAFLVAAVVACLCGALAFRYAAIRRLAESDPPRHPREGQNRYYSEGPGDSIATREAFVRRYIAIPSGARTLRYTVSIIESQEEWYTLVEVSADVDRAALDAWHSGCEPWSGPYVPPRTFSCAAIDAPSTGTQRRVTYDRRTFDVARGRVDIEAHLTH